MKKLLSLILTLFILFLFIAGCEDDPVEPGLPPLTPSAELVAMFDKIDLEKYLNIDYVRTQNMSNDWMHYFYSEDDCKCIFGAEFFVGIRTNSTKKVVFYLQGGGAKWPGGGTATPTPFNMFDFGPVARVDNNPLKDWSVVYVPYCDGSVHAGDNEMMIEDKMHYFHGLRTTSAAVALMQELFPNPDQIMVTGASAGAFGTFFGWALVKSQYLDAHTYIFNDGGPGFWNPDDLATWEVIKDAWQFEDLIPEECIKCQGTTDLTYLYETYLDVDDQVRIGMFSSYYDSVIGQDFLEMNPEDFKSHLLSVTDEIKTAHPERFARFFIEGETHTAILTGFNTAIQGTTIYDWIGKLITDGDATYDDLME